MKLRKILLIPALLTVTISCFFSCGVDRWKEYEHLIALDSWIYDVMQQDYLWYDQLPAYNDVNLFADPATFLSKVRAKEDNGYSYADTLRETPLPSYGFDYSLVRNMDNDTAYNALITYVIPESPAADAKLKRGDWIMKVNDTYITKKNEEKLLQGTGPVSLTLGAYRKIEPILPPVEGEEEEDIYNVVETGTTEMDAAKILQDNPVHTDKILTLENGANVGYLMYNSFTPGTEADPEKYNNELRRISKKFQDANIQAVILDLRYNAGGSLSSAQLLATLLAPSSLLDETMAFLQYNDKNTDKDATLTFDSNLLQGGVNLDMKVIVVIMSGTTAGAAEMLIHSLNIEDQSHAMVGIGSATKGQNVATEKFTNEEYRWNVHLATCTIYNSEHITYGSFKPTYAVSETSNYTTFLPFGDPDETLLHIAMGVLDGTYPPDQGGDTDEDKGGPLQIKPVKSFTSPASRRFRGGLYVEE